MAAQIPIKDNEEKNRMALEKVRLDKQREVKAGHDGTWVAHPGLVTTACDIFDQFMKKENQIELKREDVHVTEKDLLSIPKGEITELGLRTNINIGILYLESWLRGNGCVPLYHLMEDAATAEISRAQVWQWIRFEKGRFSNGTKITKEFVQKLIREEMSGIEKTVGPEKWGSGKYTQASTLFEELVFATEFQDFLTLKAYNFL